MKYYQASSQLGERNIYPAISQKSYILTKDSKEFTLTQTIFELEMKASVIAESLFPGTNLNQFDFQIKSCQIIDEISDNVCCMWAGRISIRL